MRLTDAFPRGWELAAMCLCYAMTGVLAWVVVLPEHFVATLLRAFG